VLESDLINTQLSDGQPRANAYSTSPSELSTRKFALKVAGSSKSLYKSMILKTLWRRERDSNPRYPFRHNGFQDRRYQPLTHPSAAGRLLSLYSLPHLHSHPHSTRLSIEGRHENPRLDFLRSPLHSQSQFMFASAILSKHDCARYIRASKSQCRHQTFSQSARPKYSTCKSRHHKPKVVASPISSN
jgi:hypothetical protein